MSELEAAASAARAVSRVSHSRELARVACRIDSAAPVAIDLCSNRLDAQKLGNAFLFAHSTTVIVSIVAASSFAFASSTFDDDEEEGPSVRNNWANDGNSLILPHQQQFQ